MESSLFYIFSSIAIFSASMLIISTSTFMSALLLIISFIMTACLWLLLDVDFLAVTLILVYIGAVMILFLFIIMMISYESEIKSAGISDYSLLMTSTSFVILLLVATLMFCHDRSDFIAPILTNHLSNVKILGLTLYKDYLFAFEVTGILFLVGMIAAVTISFRGKQNRVSQDVSKQVDVKPNDRLKYSKDE